MVPTKIILKVFLTLFLYCQLSIINSMYAQEAIDTKAKAILDDLSKKTKSYASIKAEFVMATINKDKKLTDTQKDAFCAAFSSSDIMKGIRKDLADFDVEFDNY